MTFHLRQMNGLGIKSGIISTVVASRTGSRPQIVSTSGLKCTGSLRFQVLCRQKPFYVPKWGDALTELTFHLYFENLLNCCKFVTEDATLSISALLKAFSGWMDKISEYVHLYLREVDCYALAVYLTGNTMLLINPILSKGFDFQLYSFISDCDHCCFAVLFVSKDTETIVISLDHLQEPWICSHT